MNERIADDLLPLVRPIRHLVQDPTNANQGDQDKVRRSLKRFGQRKPIVVKLEEMLDGAPSGHIEAGNTTLRAALDDGWESLAMVLVTDDPETAVAYGLADNQTGRVATWDLGQLGSNLRALDEADYEGMDALGWSSEELAALQAPVLVSDREDPEQHPMRVTFAADQWLTVARAILSVKKDEGDDMTNNRALELICADYLAGRFE